MRKSIRFRPILTILILLSITTGLIIFQACKKDSATIPTKTSTGYGNAMLWTKNGNLGTITITCNNKTASITKYYSTGEPSGCGIEGFANFYLPVGTYTFTGSNTAGINWNGSITVSDGQCTLQELTYSGSGGSGGTGGGAGNGKAMLWTQNNSLGNITVVCEGQTQIISKYSTSGRPGSCGISGFANFTLPVGNHSYTASSVSGVKWSGNIYVTANGCYLEELTYSGGGGTGNLIVWEQQDHHGGIITVTCNGQTANVTQYNPNYGVGNPPPCDTSGFANFSLAPGNYSYHAEDQNSTWDGTVTIYSGGCSKVLLQ